ncbi:MAG: SIMPL domain-containing protein, partial [Chromatocurvus sp.]
MRRSPVNDCATHHKDVQPMPRRFNNAKNTPMTLLGALFVLALSSVPVAAEHHNGRQPPAGVTVNGEGRVTALPDQAALQLGVQVRHEDLATARAEVTRRSNAVLAHLASLGIDERHINATHINVQPEYRWDKPREAQVLTGYSVQRSIDLALMDLSLLPGVLEGSADAGANQVSPPRLSHSNEAELRRDALRLATKEATANARAIAVSLGRVLGGVRDISAVGSPRP